MTGPKLSATSSIESSIEGLSSLLFGQKDEQQLGQQRKKTGSLHMHVTAGYRLSRQPVMSGMESSVSGGKLVSPQQPNPNLDFNDLIPPLSRPTVYSQTCRLC